MPGRTKFRVFVAFGSRLLLVVLSTLRLRTLKIYLSSSEPQFAVTTFLVSQQVLLASSLISATIPNLRGFLKSCSASFGVAVGLQRGLEPYPPENVLALQTIGGSRAFDRALHGNRKDPIKEGASGIYDGTTTNALRPDRAMHQTTILSDAGSQTTHEEGDDRNNSRELIIVKDVAWEVQHEKR